MIEGNRAYIPVLYVFNKIDALTIEELDILDQMPNYVPISSQHEWNLEELMETIWERTNMLRIYTKPKGQIPDYEEPVILHAENPTIEEFCNRLHRNLINDFSHAWVWGKFPSFFECRERPQRLIVRIVLLCQQQQQLFLTMHAYSFLVSFGCRTKCQAPASEMWKRACFVG